MNTNNLIKEIKKLKTIEPSKNWVLLNKRELLGEEKRFELFPFFRPAYAGMFLLLLFIGTFEIAQEALPGESLYLLKKITEKGQMILCSEKDKPMLNLELANRRLNELNEIALNNEVKKLAPAINEFQANVSAAAKNLAQVKTVDKDIVALTQKIEDAKKEAEETLATKIDTEEYDEAMATLVQGLIAEMEETTLTPEEKELLGKAKEYFENEEYSKALSEILLGQ